jgi:uncharacterized protein (TIGR03083 family)
MEEAMVESRAMDALWADRGVVLQICGELGDADWKAASGCPGWSVQDVVAHLGALFWAVVDPSVLPDTEGLPTERAQQRCVEGRRSLGPAEVVADYEEVSEEALVRLAGLSEADFEVPLGDLGTYPAWLLPAAFGFDHYIHIRADLFAPRGPLPGPPPPADELRQGVALDWIEAALPQQNQAAVAALHGLVEIVVLGNAARTIRVGPDGPAAAWVRSDADGLLRWVTQRASWEQVGADVSGDERTLACIRELKVF